MLKDELRMAGPAEVAGNGAQPAIAEVVIVGRRKAEGDGWGARQPAVIGCPERRQEAREIGIVQK